MKQYNYTSLQINKLYRYLQLAILCTISAWAIVGLLLLLTLESRDKQREIGSSRLIGTGIESVHLRVVRISLSH